MRQPDNFYSVRLRPRFVMETSVSVPVLMERIERELATNEVVVGQLRQGFLGLQMPEDKRKYWSPQLTLSIYESESGGADLYGHYGPHPAVWTMLMFIYGGIGIAILFVSIMGSSQLSLGQSASILWLVPVLVMLFLTMYLIAYIGQYEARYQTAYLHEQLEAILGFEVKMN